VTVEQPPQTHHPLESEPTPGANGPDDPTEASTTPNRGRRGRRTQGRGGHSHEHRSRGDSQDEPSARRRGHRSDTRGERSAERHAYRRSRGHGRAQRGDVRAAVLTLLSDRPMHGYQLMRAIAELTQGAWRPSPGAIYPTIAQLEDEDLVSVVADAGRKLVTLTDTGREYVRANADAIADPFSSITEQAGGRHDLRGSVEQVHAAARAVGKSGTDAQIASAQDVLIRARRDLYLILADAGTDAGTDAGADAGTVEAAAGAEASA
jgi:DNA-binding PadR family transcriptional regulator